MHSAVAFVAAAVAAAVVAALAIGFAPISTGSSTRDPGTAISPVAIDRTHKGDRLPMAVISDRAPVIVAVEVDALPNPMIVYRDAAGRELVRADPATMTTAVAKGTVIPTITVRSASRAATEPRRANPAVPSRTKPVAGCDPALSSLAVPGEANLPPRCRLVNAALLRLAAATH